MTRLFDELGAQDLRDLSAQDWGVINRCLPDQRPIDAEVLVNRMFRNPTMSGHGTELCRAVSSGLSRATASPTIVSF